LGVTSAAVFVLMMIAIVVYAPEGQSWLGDRAVRKETSGTYFICHATPTLMNGQWFGYEGRRTLFSRWLTANNVVSGALRISEAGISWTPGALSRRAGFTSRRMSYSEVMGARLASVTFPVGGVGLLLHLANGDDLQFMTGREGMLREALERVRSQFSRV
jgi:hypothetical protein